VTFGPKRDEREKLIISSLYVIVYHYVSLVVIAFPGGSSPAFGTISYSFQHVNRFGQHGFHSFL